MKDVTSFYRWIGIDQGIVSSPYVQTANDLTCILICIGKATASLRSLR